LSDDDDDDDDDEDEDAEGLRLLTLDDCGGGKGRISALSRPGAWRRGREERAWVVARRRWVQRQWYVFICGGEGEGCGGVFCRCRGGVAMGGVGVWVVRGSGVCVGKGTVRRGMMWCCVVECGGRCQHQAAILLPWYSTRLASTRTSEDLQIL